ncbi:MAG: potassium transporter Kef [Deltaproteobacteria bacterium HGW-Deltaproteobacteria-15]|jgi:Kef-type K+ transport system membrane component KefB|nr:MAG: potassium transporter Kef [Deltaproteobacteria bacterium HGW-Deltaproteobacteria-15]
MENLWFQSALWIGLALIAALLSIRIKISVALVEIVIGALAGNSLGLFTTDWINYLAGVGAILLTFLAGAEIDPAVIRKHFWSSTTIGAVGFFAPYFGVLAFTHYLCDWPWPQAQIAGIALSTTSVAVVYAVMVETGFNRTEMGKIILAACFINDIGTVLALGIVFANYNMWLVLFMVVTALAMWLLPRFVPWYFAKVGSRISEPETKFILLVLFFLGGLGNMAKSEAVLPAYLVGMVLAPFFLKERVLAQRIRVIAFTLLTPFYFLKAGSLVKFETVISALGLIALLLGVKMLTKFIGIWPLTKAFRFERKEGMYTTLMMCTGLTFGSISALFGLTNGIIDQDQYTILVTAVIGSAVVPTLIAQKFFQPEYKTLEEENHV